MRLKRMIMTIALAAVAAMAVAAVGAGAASAIEGPFYRVEKINLAAGTSKTIVNAKATEPYVLKGKLLFFEVTITCNKSTVSKGKIIGTRSSEEIVEFSECAQSGNGSSTCKPAEPIKTSEIVNTLVYTKENRTGPIGVLFEPKAAGTAFTTISWKGSGCLTEEPATVTGNVAAEAWSGGKAVEVGKEPPESKLGEVHFPATPIKVVWIEEPIGSNILVKRNVGLVYAGNAATLTGGTSFELEGSPLWGVFT